MCDDIEEEEEDSYEGDDSENVDNEDESVVVVMIMLNLLIFSSIHIYLHTCGYTGFNNRARNPKNYGNNKIFPDSWQDALQQSFAAMPVTRWSTVHQNFFFINAWVSGVLDVIDECNG